MVDPANPGFRNRKRRPRWSTLVLIAAAHVVAIFGLAAAFAPKWTGEVIEDVGSLVTVTITAPEEPEPEPSPDPKPDEGAAAPEAPKAKPKEAAAPDPPVKVNPKPAPKAASTGEESRSGGGETGTGTGAGGQGDGTGSGRSGTGQGGGLVPVTKPSVRSGELNTASDFSVPEGGRKSRFGKAVTVAFTVTTDGRAKNCSILRSSVDAQTASEVCPLVMRKIRFNPATNRNGNPVESRYGYEVRFDRR